LTRPTYAQNSCCGAEKSPNPYRPRIEGHSHGQAVDSYRLCVSALKKGSLSKPLIYKASRGPNTIYQQSYPQKDWICRDALSNQGLTATFDSFSEERPPNMSHRDARCAVAPTPNRCVTHTNVNNPIYRRRPGLSGWDLTQNRQKPALDNKTYAQISCGGTNPTRRPSKFPLQPRVEI